MKKLKKWEYKSFCTEYGQLKVDINTLGKEGWELVSVVNIDTDSRLINYEQFFIICFILLIIGFIVAHILGK